MSVKRRMTAKLLRDRIAYCDANIPKATGKRRELLENIKRECAAELGVTCRRCGTRLEDPQSIARGLGPDCAEQLGVAS